MQVESTKKSPGTFSGTLLHGFAIDEPPYYFTLGGVSDISARGTNLLSLVFFRFDQHRRRDERFAVDAHVFEDDLDDRRRRAANAGLVAQQLHFLRFALHGDLLCVDQLL